MDEGHGMQELVASFARADEPQETVAPQEGAVQEEPSVAQEEPQPIAEQKPVDLTELPEFRKYQSQYDRDREEYRKRLEALEERNKALERERIELSMAGMSPGERAEYENRLLKQQMGQLQQARVLEQQSSAMRGWADNYLKEAGLTQKDLNPADYPDPFSFSQAVTNKALEKERKRLERQRQKRDETVEARKPSTAVDTGSAPPSGGKISELQDKMKKLKGSGNVYAAFNLEDQMDELRRGE